MDHADAALRDAFHIAVGFGILGVQQAQLRRRDLQKELARAAVRVDEKVEPVLDDLVAKLPDDMRPLATQARSAAMSARRVLLGQPR
jgi:RecJ-like exonuclease